MAGDRFAILIGCNNYPKDSEQFSTLRCAENDAKGVRDILADKCNFNKENLKLFTSEAHWEILREINMRLKQVQCNDFVLIYFSGHGKLDEENMVHLAVSNTEVCALDATSLPVRSIKNYIDKFSSNRVVLILDCCYSGAVERLYSKGSVNDALRAAAYGGKGKYILTASTGIQVAQEKEGEKNSIFTKYFIEGLKTGDADLDNDGKITVDELYSYVHAKVKRDSFQEPMKFAWGARGNIVLVEKVVRKPTPISLSVKKLLSEKTHELVGYTALRDELVYVQTNFPILEGYVASYFGELASPQIIMHSSMLGKERRAGEIGKKGEIGKAISEVNLKLAVRFDTILSMLKKHPVLRKDSKLTELEKAIIEYYFMKIKKTLDQIFDQTFMEIPMTLRSPGSIFATYNDLNLNCLHQLSVLDRVVSKIVSDLDCKIEYIGEELVKIFGSEENKNAYLLKPSGKQ